MHEPFINRRFRPISQSQHRDISERVCPMRYETSGRSLLPDRTLLARRLGAATLARYESCGLEHGTRTIQHIREEPVDYFLLCMSTRARLHFSHAGLETDIEDGSAVLLSAQRLFDAFVYGHTEDDWHSTVQVRIPGPLLRARLPKVDYICNQPISVASGPGAILDAHLQASLQQAASLSEAQAARQSGVLADVIVNALLDLSGNRPLSFSRRLSGQMVFDHAVTFIEGQLSVSGLDTDAIARHCRVSSRYLHKVFAQRSETVAGLVREMRLQRCRDSLLDPQLTGRSVSEIVSRWGFEDAAHFSRLYKRRFGHSPSQARSVTLAIAPPSSKFRIP